MNKISLKKEIKNALTNSNLEIVEAKFSDFSKISLINALLPLLYHADESLKSKAIMLIGKTLSNLVEENMEDARNIMRRFIWNLNDESGSFALGMPEAMAEAMGHNQKLYDEYSKILISYINPNGNFLEHPYLQQSVIKGILRLAQLNKDFKDNKELYKFLKNYRNAQDEIVKKEANSALKFIEDKI